jgi:hypothetical protein
VTFNGRKLVGIYNKMRYLKYGLGGWVCVYFQPYYDGITELNNGVISMLIVQLYLNDGFIGGNTRFSLDNFDNIVPTDVEFVDVIPKTGSILVLNMKFYMKAVS